MAGLPACASEEPDSFASFTDVSPALLLRALSRHSPLERSPQCPYPSSAISETATREARCVVSKHSSRDCATAVSGPPAIRAARKATSTVPIVMGAILVDPVQAGYVHSLARPGGNITGMASQYEDILTKQVELLTETVPKHARLFVLRHTSNKQSYSHGERVRRSRPEARAYGDGAQRQRRVGVRERLPHGAQSRRARDSCAAEPLFGHPSWAADRSGRSIPASCNLRAQRVRAGRRSHFLPGQHSRDASKRHEPRRSHPPGRQSR